MISKKGGEKRFYKMGQSIKDTLKRGRSTARDLPFLKMALDIWESLKVTICMGKEFTTGQMSEDMKESIE